MKIVIYNKFLDFDVPDIYFFKTVITCCKFLQLLKNISQ